VSDLDSPSSSDSPYFPSTPDHLLDEAPLAGDAPGLSEGLPSGFRMRHDARRLQHVFAPERPASPVKAAPPEPPSARDDAGRLDPASARELTRHLGAIASCLHVLADGGRSLREQVVTDLARTELQRATCFVQGLQVLGEDPVLTRRSLRVLELIHQALTTVEPERRLAGVDAALDVAAIDVVVPGDERWLGACLAGMAGAMLAVMQAYRVRGARLAVGGSASSAAVSIEMSQDVVTFPPGLLARFFDLEWTDRPGGPIVAVPLVAAARIAELHGGRVEAAAGPRGGCRLTLTLPRAH
jgi:C4-dicarboxylate-specific signal transduction histidine kinase